jgi:minichromosome maintenance protein 10
VNLKLIDFGCRSDSGANGGKAVIRGDAFLSLLLFESDSFDTLDTNSGGLPKKIYKGGSKGAFEHMSKLREGAVIALLTPKILKPFQVGRFSNRHRDS